MPFAPSAGCCTLTGGQPGSSEVTPSGEAVFAWFHLEHQSQAERLMAFRVLRYHVHRWSTYLRSPAGRARGRLPLVLSVVVLHDRDGRQPPARLSALYDAPEALVARLRPLLPEYTLLVDDLMARSEEDQGQRAASALDTLTLWLLKVRGEVAPEGLGACEALFRRLAAEEGAEVARAVLHYVLRTSREADPVALQAARAVDAQLTEDVMGIWQQRIEEGVARGREVGREEGREVGREEGRSSVLLALLSARFGTIPPETEGRVRDADAVTVARWALRVLSAQSLAEVFEDG